MGFEEQAPPVSTAAVFTLTPIGRGGVRASLLLRQSDDPAAWPWPLAIWRAGALWVIFRADITALIAFDVGRRARRSISPAASPICALYTPVAQAEPGRECGCSAFRHLVAGAWCCSSGACGAILAALNWRWLLPPSSGNHADLSGGVRVLGPPSCLLQYAPWPCPRPR